MTDTIAGGASGREAAENETPNTEAARNAIANDEITNDGRAMRRAAVNRAATMDQRPRTRLLVSVRDAAEAAVALAGGAEVIDLKEPSAGALGAVALPVIAEALAAVGGRRLTSATIGDHPPGRIAPVLAAARRIAATRVDFVKIGLEPGPQRDDLIEVLGEALGAPHRLLGVMFADRGYDRALLPRLAGAGFRGVVVDTADKRGGSLLDHLDAVELGRFVETARGLGLMSGLAGALRREHFATVVPLAPDLVGVRGAACAATARTAALDPARVADLVGLVAAIAAHEPVA